MPRFQNYDWDLREGSKGDGSAASWDDVKVAVLMDVRDELRRIRKVFECHNAQAIPQILRDIRAQMIHVRINTTKPKRRRVVRRKAA